MKCVILAGGEGTRLRPLTCRLPKPMVPVLDRPVLEHIINLLTRRGINQLAVTLQFLPQSITSYFGDGSQWGADIRYYTETTPLGTAGGVKNCESFVGGEDFLVISGDAMCDLDLNAALNFHRAHNADATVVLYRHGSPLEYGLVLTEPSGRVSRFVEKPGWGQVFSNLVNTGIYILSPRALQRIPAGQFFDFSKDLFPLMMREGMGIYGCELPGYWCDIGDSRAYLESNHDALKNRIQGIDCRTLPHTPPGVIVRPPCYISPTARIEPGAVIGPLSVIGDGAVIGAGARISGSVVNGRVDIGCDIANAIVQPGARIGERSTMAAGSIVGSGATIGRGVQIQPGVRLWPGVRADDGQIVSRNIQSGGAARALVFDGGGITGRAGVDITLEHCAAIGAALGALADEHAHICVGSTGGAAAEALASAIAVGIGGGGCAVLRHDLRFAAGGGAMSRLTRSAFSVFVETRLEVVNIRLYARDGLPLSRADQRKIEGQLLRGETHQLVPSHTGREQRLTGAFAFYAADVARVCALSQTPDTTGGAARLGVLGSRPAAVACRDILLSLGFDVVCCREGVYPFPVLAVDDDGGGLSVGHNGRMISREACLGLAAHSELALGMGSAVLPYDAPAVLDRMDIPGGASLLRTVRDGGGAQVLFAQQRFMHDGVATAVRLALYARATGRELIDLCGAFPAFTTYEVELDDIADRGAAMRELAGQLSDYPCEHHDGLRVTFDTGSVRVTPCAGRPALRIVGEGYSEEYARDLCQAVVDRARQTTKP